jgi:hypothetical protein
VSRLDGFLFGGRVLMKGKKKIDEVDVQPSTNVPAVANNGRVSKRGSRTNAAIRNAAASSYAVSMSEVPASMLREAGTGGLDRDSYAKGDYASLMKVFAVLRSMLWKLDVAWYTRRDAIDVQAFISSGAKPSDVAKALAGASLDPYWRKRDHITFQQLLASYGVFVTRYNEHAAGRPTKQDGGGRNELIEMLGRMKIEIAASAPFYSKQFEDVDTTRMSTEEIRALVGEALKIVAKYGRKTRTQ